MCARGGHPWGNSFGDETFCEKRREGQCGARASAARKGAEFSSPRNWNGPVRRARAPRARAGAHKNRKEWPVLRACNTARSVSLHKIYFENFILAKYRGSALTCFLSLDSFSPENLLRKRAHARFFGHAFSSAASVHISAPGFQEEQFFGQVATRRTREFGKIDLKLWKKNWLGRLRCGGLAARRLARATAGRFLVGAIRPGSRLRTRGCRPGAPPLPPPCCYTQSPPN